MAVAGRFEQDGIVGRYVQPHPADAPAPATGASDLAARLPGSTIALLSGGNLGTGLKAGLDGLKACPATAPAADEVEKALAGAGGLEGLLGWAGTVAVVVTSNGSTPAGGIVIVPTDVAKASQALASLRNSWPWPADRLSPTVRDEPYGDGTITTFDFGGIGQLFGAVAGSSGVPGSSATPGLPVSGNAELSFSVQRGVAVIGVGPAFVKSVLDARPGASLADQPRYQAAAGRLGSSSRLNTFFDLAAIRSLAERSVGDLPSGAGSYAADARPYLAPFDVAASGPRHRRRARPRHVHPHRHQAIGTQEVRSSMAVRIRLTRVGATKQPTYRVVVAEAKTARDGRSIETIGHYNPRSEPIELSIDAERAKKWLAQGARPSETVERLLRTAGILPAAK